MNEAYEHLWMVGDDFVQSTFESSVMNQNAVDYYMKDSFNITELSSSRTGEGNIMNRLINNIIMRINDQVLWPKLIVTVIDNNFTTTTQHNLIYDDCVHYIIKNLHEEIVKQKERLPLKAKKFKYPTILWLMPLSHVNFNDNEKRESFAVFLEKAVMQYNEMRFARMKTWD